MKCAILLIILFIFYADLSAQEVNRALNAFGTMSSESYGASAERALDGNTDGNIDANSIAHTQHEEEPWIQVDIGFVDRITHITLYNRTDCCRDRLDDYHVFVSENQFTGTTIAEIQAEPGVWEYSNPAAPDSSHDFAVNQPGRYVRFMVNNSGDPEPINIAEIEVYAMHNGLEEQRITFDTISRMATTAGPYTLSASSNSGLPISFSLISGSATISGSVLTLTGDTGMVTVQADQAGNRTYNPAPPAQRSFEVVDPSTVFPKMNVGSVSNGYPVKMPDLQTMQIDAGVTIDYPDLFEVSNVKFSIDGQPVTAYKNDNLYSILWTPPAYGSYTLSVEALATTGTSSTKTITMDIEDDPSNIISKRTFADALISSPNAKRTFTGTYMLPSGVGAYDQLIANLSITCPSGGCDPWDRVAWVEVQRPDGEWIEIIRYITPYGVACDHTIDITDFMYLLQGEVTLRMFIDTWAQGWNVTLDLDYRAGNPRYAYSRVDKIWDGKFDFGNYANLQPVDTVTYNHHEDTEASTLKLVTTGHGWDAKKNTANAAEFFHATHHIKINGVNTFTQDLWATCNPNPDGCQPQNGTWYHNRAGWCPGAIASIYNYNMTPYRNTPDLELSYIFQEDYVDLCHPNHPQCVSGVTCDNCNASFNPHYWVAANMISFANVPLLDTSNSISGIDNIELDEISVFPNPSEGLIQIRSSEPLKQVVIKIYDILGRAIYSADKKILHGQEVIDMSDAKSGFYLIYISTKEGIYTQEIVIR